MENACKILIVDDDENLRKTLEDILQIYKFEPISVASGKEAIETINKKAYPLALIDLHLKDIPGLDVLKAIKEISPETECIILTGFASTESAIQSVNLGAYSYIQKPYNAEQLILTIKHALEQKTISRSLSNTEERYTQLFNGAQDGIVTVTFKGKILESNASFQKMVGYSADELSKMTFWDLTPEKWHAVEEKIVREQIINRGYSDLYQKEYKHKDGTIFPIEVSAYLTKNIRNEAESMWAFVRDISNRKRSEAALNKQLQEVTILQQLTSIGAAATNIDDLLQAATILLGQSFYSDNFGIFLYNEEEKILHRHYSYKTNVEDDQFEGYNQPIDIGILGREVQTRLSQRVADVTKDTDYHEAYSEIRSELVVPIIVNDKVFGVVNTENPVIGHFTEEDERLLSTLADQLSSSITKIQLDKSEKQRTKEIAMLYDTAIATSNILDTESLYQKIYEQVQESFPLDTFLLMEYDVQDETSKIAFVMEEGKPIKEWMGKTLEKSESGLIGWVIQQRKPFLSYDLTKDTLPVKSPSSEKPTRSWLGVPLIAKGKIVGGLSVQAFAPNVFNENHQRLLESLAAQLANAVDNAQLAEKSQRQI